MCEFQWKHFTGAESGVCVHMDTLTCLNEWVFAGIGGSWWLSERLRGTRCINMHKLTHTYTHFCSVGGGLLCCLCSRIVCKQLPHSSNSRFQTILCQQWLTQQTKLNHMGTQTHTVHLHNANAYTLYIMQYLNNNSTNKHTNRKWDMLLRLIHTHRHRHTTPVCSQGV